MYYFDIERKVFLHPSVHAEVADGSVIDESKYVKADEDTFRRCINKRSQGYAIYAKDGVVKITDEVNPDDRYWTLSDDGKWILTEENEKRLNEDKKNEKIDSLREELKDVTEKIIFNIAMDRQDEIVILREQAAKIENDINNITK